MHEEPRAREFVYDWSFNDVLRRFRVIASTSDPSSAPQLLLKSAYVLLKDMRWKSVDLPSAQRAELEGILQDITLVSWDSRHERANRDPLTISDEEVAGIWKRFLALVAEVEAIAKGREPEKAAAKPARAPTRKKPSRTSRRDPK